MGRKVEPSLLPAPFALYMDIPSPGSLTMSSMFAVYHKPPHSPRREAVLTKQVSHLGGRLSFREEPEVQERGAVC